MDSSATRPAVALPSDCASCPAPGTFWWHILRRYERTGGRIVDLSGTVLHGREDPYDIAVGWEKTLDRLTVLFTDLPRFAARNARVREGDLRPRRPARPCRVGTIFSCGSFTLEVCEYTRFSA